jgi:hypothetical protein
MTGSVMSDAESAAAMTEFERLMVGLHVVTTRHAMKWPGSVATIVCSAIVRASPLIVMGETTIVTTTGIAMR